jgi:hypothetical protein
MNGREPVIPLFDYRPFRRTAEPVHTYAPSARTIEAQESMWSRLLTHGEIVIYRHNA